MCTLSGHTSGIFYLDFSPDGKRIASSGGGVVNIWDIASGKLLHRLLTHSTLPALISFNPKENVLATVIEGGRSISLWDLDKGVRIENLPVQSSDDLYQISFSNDGNFFAEMSRNGVEIWDLASHSKILNLPNYGGGFRSIIFSPDDTQLITINADKSVNFWNTVNGNLIQTVKDSGSAGTPFLSRDAKQIAFLEGQGLRIYQTDNYRDYKEQLFIKNNAETASPDFYDISALTFSIDGKSLIAGGSGQSRNYPVKIWETKAGREVSSFGGNNNPIKSLAFTPSGRNLVSGAFNLKLWDLINDAPPENLRRQSDAFETIAFNPQNNTMASEYLDYSKAGWGIKLWNLSDTQQSLLLPGHSNSIRSLAFSNNGKFLASGSWDKSIILWDAVTGKKLSVFNIDPELVSAVALSPDGKLLAGNDKDYSLSLWDTSNGKKVRTLKIAADLSGEAKAISFSPDGKTLAAGGYHTTKIWDANTGAEIHSLEGSDGINSIAFSSDGKLLASGDIDHYVKVWDAASGNLLYKFSSHAGTVNSVAFIPNSQVLASASDDNTIKLWDIKPGKEIGTITTTGDDDWLVTTPEGLFDGTPAAWKQIVWRFNNDTFNYAPVEIFFKEYYYPGLLQEIIQGKSPKPLNKDLSQIDIRQPQLKITEIDNHLISDLQPEFSADKSAVKVKIEVVDNPEAARKSSFPLSSGANDLRLFRNGSLVKIWGKDVFELGADDGCQQIPVAADSPRKTICETQIQIKAGKNEFTAYAFNHDNVKSNDALAVINGADNLKRKGKIHILSIGINEYQNPSYKLNFAEPDAVDFGNELRKQQISLANYDVPEVVLLKNAEATKANILYALERFAKGDEAKTPEALSGELKNKLSSISKTQPEDVLVIYFAGHGFAQGNRFYLIPHDLGVSDDIKAVYEDKLKILRDHSISDLELETLFRTLDAGELMLIIDACNSGQALESEEKRRGPMNSKGLAQLAFDKGMYILTAAQSYQSALEVSRTPEGTNIGHGLLTYSLLEGLISPQADTNTDKQISEREWLNFAVNQVPKLQFDAMKQRSIDIKATGRGSDIIEVVDEDKNLPPEKRGLQTPRVFYRRENSPQPFIVAKQ